MKPKISVVIACYNEEDRIGKCLTTLLGQTAQPHEIIIVDGGSTDNTVIKIKEFQKKNKLIKLLHETGKRSPANARNIGWKAASGDYILFLDADGQFDKSFIEVVDRAIAGKKTEQKLIMYHSVINSWKEVFLKYFWYGRTIPKYLLKNKKDYKTLFGAFASFGLVVLPLLHLFWQPYALYLFLLDAALVLGIGLKNAFECYRRSGIASFLLTIPIYNLFISFVTGIGIALIPFLYLTGKYDIGR